LGDQASPKMRCSSCGSRHLLRADYLATGAMGAAMTVTAKVSLGGRKILLKKSAVAADVCLDCGIIRLCATDLPTLREASRAASRG
jgi:hypothetical protein